MNGKLYTPLSQHASHHGGTVQLSPSDKQYWINLLYTVLLLFVAGLCSGLTLGYMSIDELSLELKLSNGSSEEKEMSRTILPLVH